MNVFERYAPFIQDYIYRSGWQALRGVQNAAGSAIFGTEDNVLLTASTASGKTEAAFFPILTLLEEDPPASVGGSVHSPLKGPDQRSVRKAGGALRGGRDLCDTVARGRAPEPEAQASAEALRHSADHPGIPGISDDQQAYGDPFPVWGSAFYCH